MADGNGPKMSAIDMLRARHAAAKIEAETPVLSEDDREEARLRREIAEFEEKRRAAEQEARGLDLDRRVEAAREAMPGKIVRGLMSDGYLSDRDDGSTFVLVYSGSKAFEEWDRISGAALAGIKDPKTKSVPDKGEVDRAYAMTLVYDWNGERVTKGTDVYARLEQHLREFAGTTSSMCMQGRAMSGAAKEARKS